MLAVVIIVLLATLGIGLATQPSQNLAKRSSHLGDTYLSLMFFSTE
jgi:hypothetical protein